MKRELLAFLALLMCGYVQAQMSPQQKVAFEDRLMAWVRAAHPELINATGLSDRTMVAFVVDSRDKILGQARGIQPHYTKPTPVVDEVRRMVPQWKDAQFNDSGGACFGNPKNGSKFCVIYGQLPK